MCDHLCCCRPSRPLPPRLTFSPNRKPGNEDGRRAKRDVDFVTADNDLTSSWPGSEWRSLGVCLVSLLIRMLNVGSCTGKRSDHSCQPSDGAVNPLWFSGRRDKASAYLQTDTHLRLAAVNHSSPGPNARRWGSEVQEVEWTQSVSSLFTDLSYLKKGHHQLRIAATHLTWSSFPTSFSHSSYFLHL